MLDKPREVKGDLRICRCELRIGGRDGARLAQPVDLDHPGHDGAAGILPHEPSRQRCRQA